MGPRYTKAIIMLVVGSPVLAAGIIIENSLETNSSQNSTVTIARLMIAAGACMVAIGIFICCIIITTNKKEEPSSQPSTDVQLHRVRITPAPHTQSHQRGVQLVTYSPLPESQGVPYPQASRFNRTPVINSPVTQFQSSVVVANTPGNQNGSSQTDSSATRNSGQQHSNSPAPQIQNSNPSVAQSQRSNASEAKSQRSNTSEAKSQRSKASEGKAQKSKVTEIRSQRTYVSQAKSQLLNTSDAKIQRLNNIEAKSQRPNPSEAKSQRSSVIEAKNSRSNISESKSQRSVSSEAKSHRSSASESKSHRSNTSEAKSQRSSVSEAKSQRSSASEAKMQRSNISDSKGHRSCAAQSKNPNPSASPSSKKRCSTSDIPNPVHLPCFSTPKNTSQPHSLSSESLIYPVNASDMAKLLIAAKKTMDPRTFKDIAKTYSIVYCSSSSSDSQGELPTTGDLPIKRQVISSCLSSSAGQLTESAAAAGSICLANPMTEQLDLAATLPLGRSSSPSAPPYQGPSPEFDPPPYSP